MKNKNKKQLPNSFSLLNSISITSIQTHLILSPLKDNNMNKRQAGILNLHYDILKEIVIRVARSSDGASNFANSLSVCKPFQQFVEDGDVLKAVDFHDLLISNRCKLFQLKQGLIYRCAQAGNPEAQFILAKIILVSTSQLLRAARMETTDLNPSSYSTASLAKGKLDRLLLKQNPQLIRFMRNFFPNKNNLNTPGLHSNLVRLFLTRARFVEYKEMQPYMTDYMEYFLGHRGYNPNQFLLLFNGFCSSTAEKRLEVFQAKFAKETTQMCLRLLNCMESIGLKEAELRLRELVVAEEEHGGFTMATLVEKFDESIKRFRTVRAVVEEEIGKTFNSLGNKEGFGKCLYFSSKYVEAALLIENGALESKGTALFYEDQRVNMVCKFDGLFCQLMTNNSSE